MSRAYLHKIEALADDGRPVRELGHSRPRPSLVAEPALEDLLERCAHGDADGIEAVRHWQNGRLSTTLERMLGDHYLAQQAFHNMIADLANYTSAHRAGAETAEDWLFGRLRWHARNLHQSERPAPQPRGTPAMPLPPSPIEQPAHANIAPAELSLAVDLEPPAVYPRLRRPNAPAHSTKVNTFAVMEPPAPPRWRRVALLLLLWLGVGAAGFTALALFVPGRPAMPPPIEAVIPPAPALPSQPILPTPDARALLGPPIAAREPTALALPQQLAVEDEPSAAPMAAPRVVIHYSTGNASGASLAQSIAAALGSDRFGEPEIRAVPQTVATASIRYFHAADRDAAARLVASVRPLLAGAGRAAPVTPIDFTDFTPLPRPGTLEIWVPSR